MEQPVPEWVDSQGRPINGLDLTGLRLPVDAISNYQLIGITTVTPRIRFLSIRAWIVKAFGDSGLPNTQDAFADFALRVETAIIFSVLLNDRNLPYLPGVAKALTVIDEGIDPIALERLVDQPGVNLYAGTTYNLFLGFAQDGGLPGLTQERGLPLAEVFESLINETRFFAALKANPEIDSVSIDDLTGLGRAIRLDEISEAERACLLEALMPSVPAENWMQRETRRVGTYSMFHELAKHHRRKPKEKDVFQAALAVDSPLPSQLTEVLDGYLCYRIRDALAVVHEAVLGLVCRELGGHEGAVHHDKIIHALVTDEGSNDALRNLGLLNEGEAIDTVRFRTFVERVDALLSDRQNSRGLVRWQGDLDENTLIEANFQNRDRAAGLLPVVWLLCRRRVPLDDPEAFPHLKMLLQGGSARFGLREVIFPQLEAWSVENPLLVDVISWLIQRTVDQHLRIAWSRMFVDINKDVAILLCDGEYWQHRGRNYQGGRMMSRIPDAIGWLDQLGLLDEEGLTKLGQEALQHGYDVLTRFGGEA